MDLNYEIQEVFTIENMLFDISFQELLKNMKDKDFETVIQILKVQIEDNYECKKYSNFVKKNIYELLLIMKHKTADDKIIKKIEDLETVLFNSENTNVDDFIHRQFYLRYSGMVDRFTLVKCMNSDATKLEHVVNESIVNDLPFFQSLINDEEEQFIKKYCYDIISLTNISFLINQYPKILKQENIKSKLKNFLNEVLRISKKKIIQNIINGEKQIIIIPNEFKTKSKLCIKQMEQVEKDIIRGKII